MRHRKAGRQFSRNSSHRRAMLRALTANLVAHERIETTEAKAKELRRVAERLITKARRLGKVAYAPLAELKVAERARRQAVQAQVGQFLRRFGTVIREGQETKIDLVEKVFLDLAKRFKDRPGGYTRIIKLGPRRGDNAPMVRIEFVGEADAKASDAGGEPEEAPKKPKPLRAKKAAAPAEAPSEA
jgi:large subunit ribosomal protein L17